METPHNLLPELPCINHHGGSIFTPHFDTVTLAPAKTIMGQGIAYPFLNASDGLTFAACLAG